MTALLRVPTGTRQTCRFGFPLRELTPEEEETFKAGGPLPNGVGHDPPKVLLEYQRPGDSKSHTIEGSGINREGPGEYNAVVAVPLEADGGWQWRGRGEEEDGTPVACTPPQSFNAYRTF